MSKIKIEVQLDLEDIDNEAIFRETLSRLKAIKKGKGDYFKKFPSKANINKSYAAYNNFVAELIEINNE